MTKMNESDFKPGDIVRWIGEWAFPLVDAPPRENTVLAIEADGKVRLEGRHGGEAPLQWWCPPDQLVRREPVQAVALEIGEAALDAPSLQAAEDNNECSACGETCHWNDDADRDDPDPLCNPCAQQIASEEVATAKAVVRDAARAHKARSEDAREYREFLRWQAEAVARSVFGIIGHTPEPLSHVVYEGGDGRTVTVIGGDPLKADANDILSRGAIEAHQMRELLSLTLGGPEVKLGAGVRELAGLLDRFGPKTETEAERQVRDAIAERLRNIMSTCFDGSRSGDLAFQLEDMEKWIPKFTSEWKANHRRWLDLCDRLGLDALDLAQHGRVAEVDVVAGDAFELRRIRAIVEDDARKRHGDREGEPSWGVIADCVLGHASQHRQAREILGVAENVTLDQGLSELRQVLWAFEASLVSSGEWSTYPSRTMGTMGTLARAVIAQAEQWRDRWRDAEADDRTFLHKLRLAMGMASGTPRDVLAAAEVLVRELKEAREQICGAMNLIASLHADLTRVEPSAARAEIQDVLASLSAMKEPPPAGLTLTEAVSWLVQRRDEYKVLFEDGVDETRACRAHLTARHAEIDETREALAPIVKGPVRSVKALSMGALAREVVAQAERWRIDAEHYRGEASNATAKQVESLSAAVARLTGEAWRHMDRDLIEADEALRAQVGKSIGPVPLPRQLPLLLWFIAGYLESTARDTKRSTEATPLTPAAAPKVRCTGNVTVRINKDRVIVKGQTWTSDDPNFKAWDVSLHDDDPRFGWGPQPRDGNPQTMELGARTGTWTWKGSMGGFGDIKWQGTWTAEPKQAASTEVERLDYSRFPPGYSGETTIADAWAEWKSEHDPPGITLFCHGPTWSWQLDSADEAFEGTYPSADEARAAAWAWYDRRLAVVRALDAMSKGGYSRANWPRCLTWSRVQVDEVERWLTDPEPFALLPIVLRGGR